MSENYYSNKLYPLQDIVCGIIKSCNTDFYLTGGTPLSRFFFNHRYSDDLDFFQNWNPDFHNQFDNALTALKTHPDKFSIRLEMNDEYYKKLFINQNEIELKIDFVNDVEFHLGAFESSSWFDKIDNCLNILSNKVCAISRNEPKDFADLLIISRNYHFNWINIIDDARQKDTWVNEIEVSKRIHDFDADRFTEIKWIEKIDFPQASHDFKTIAKDILLGVDNSLVEKK